MQKPDNTPDSSPDSVKVPVVHLQQLQFRWSPRGPLVLDIPALSVARGERLFIYGPSGSGKTSLLNLMAGVTAAGPGQLLLLGQDTALMSQRQRDRFRAGHIGVIFQQFNLIPYLNLLDNVLLGGRFAPGDQTLNGLRQRALALLQHLGLSPSLFDQPARNLSLGQQQRAAVARALLTRPELLIADEPSSALDSDSRDAFMQLLMDTAAESRSTVIFVSHDRSLQSGFDRALDMRELSLCCDLSLKREPAPTKELS